MKAEGRPVSGHRLLVTLVLASACAACATVVQPSVVEGNVLTYHHPFTDAAAQAAQENAGRICAERKQVAVRTGNACSLKECTAHYQCVAKAAGK